MGKTKMTTMLKLTGLFDSLRAKLIFIIVLSLVIAMFISSAVFVFYDRKESHAKLHENITAMGNVTAERSSAALAFGDKTSIRQNLSALMTVEIIDSGCVYDKGGEIYSEVYRKGYNGPLCARKFGVLERWRESDVNHLIVDIPISKRGISHGYLVISASLKSLYDRSLKIFWVTVMVSLISILFAYLITRRLQNKLVEPIESLSRAADKVTESQDFSVRATRMSNDEVGVLVDSFNSMLQRIQGAHGQLRDMVSELEEQSLRLKYHAKTSETKRDEVQTLLASASHDLKQPLQAMAMFTAALRDTSPQDQPYLFDKLERAIENMRQLFTDLMDVSSLEKRMNMDKQEEVIYLPGILEQVSTEFSVLASNKGLTLRTRFNECSIYTHASTFQRIIRNLLNNALRYTEEGGILLACKKRASHVLVEIWDTGAGIESDKLQDIFKQFVQVNDDKEKSSQGVGLGLSIVRRSCELLDYKISVHSRVGKGSVFRIKIPASKIFISDGEADTATTERRAPALNDSPEVVSPQSLVDAGDKSKGKHICLIDDDPDIRESLALLLQGWGVNVLDAESLESMLERVDKLNGYVPDLILSDYQLSDNQLGDQVIESLRSHFGISIPAIIVTGIGDPEAIKALKKRGYKVLSKPVRPAKLRSLMNHLLTD